MKTEERIEKEAEELVSRSFGDRAIKAGRKKWYIAGATSERNKAIDDVVKLVFEDDGDFKQYESPSSIMNKIQALKIK